MKRILFSAAVLLGVGAFMFLSLGSGGNSVLGTYKIQLDNAFGLVPGADFKVAGVKAGKIEKLDLDQKSLHAVVTVSITQPGFSQFHADAFCQTRPQSLIGEYFVECQPGSQGKVLKPGSTIPVTHTQSTIPGDLLQDVMRLPYRQRFTLLINELGAAVAGRGEDIRQALRRVVPALTQTDNLLNLLANDSHTLQQLTVNSDAVFTALANNNQLVARFIDEANRAGSATAAQAANVRAGFARLPGFLEQLRPAMAQLGQATDANTPVLQNLNLAAGQLSRFFHDLPGFAHSSLPALRALGQASITGRQAAVAATPTVRHLNTFAKPAPELAKNLAIVLQHLDDRRFATEPDSRSPGGKGFTGLEDLLQFVFNTATAINTYGAFGHELAVDLFVDQQCSPYATPALIAQNLAKYGSQYRHCYAFLGPDQQGVTTPDPSNPSACIPDPGGAPPGHKGLSNVHACKLSGAAAASDQRQQVALAQSGGGATAGNGIGSAASGATSGPGSGGTSLSSILTGALGAPSSGRGGSGSQTQQLLNYLLAP